jgi:uncharacterized lipoprotein NlpE involved in copper resistance
MKNKSILTALSFITILSLVGCNSKPQTDEFDPKNNNIGYQWEDPTKPILKEANEEVSFRIISSKNSLALDYKDMDVFKNLAKSTNVSPIKNTNTTYSCPNGYTDNGTKCYKTSNPSTKVTEPSYFSSTDSRLTTYKYTPDGTK